MSEDIRVQEHPVTTNGMLWHRCRRDLGAVVLFFKNVECTCRKSRVERGRLWHMCLSRWGDVSHSECSFWSFYRLGLFTFENTIPEQTMKNPLLWCIVNYRSCSLFNVSHRFVYERVVLTLYKNKKAQYMIFQKTMVQKTYFLCVSILVIRFILKKLLKRIIILLVFFTIFEVHQKKCFN